MVGILMYWTATRPDLMYAISLISIFMESPKDSHWNVGKIILRYMTLFWIYYASADVILLILIDAGH